jgi:hypothetical protein
MTRTPLAALAALLSCPGPRGAADDPPVGTTLSMPVLSVSVSAGGSDRESRRAFYAPPPGWYVRSHRVVPARRSGSVAYAVSTVPAGWAWRTEDRAAAEGQSSAAADVSAYKLAAGGRGAVARSATASGLQSGASSHHLLVVEASARGPGWWGGESAVELTVVAELVYLGKCPARTAGGVTPRVWSVLARRGSRSTPGRTRR